MTQFRLGPSISGREYEILSVPVWAPADPDAQEIRGDTAVDTTPLQPAPLVPPLSPGAPMTRAGS
jgi:hypothetical protein